MSLDDIRAAIVCSLDDPRGKGKDAQSNLTRFEGSREAWDVAAQLLQDPSADPKSQSRFQFFGAKMLYSKIQKDFDQLSPNEVPTLMQSLVQHIIALSTQPATEMRITRYMCLSIAALAIQVNQSGVIRSVLQWLNPLLVLSPHVVLEFLDILPEECVNERVDVPRESRESFELQLTESFEDVMLFLESQWAAASTSNRIKICTCVRNWVEFARIKVEVLIKQPIYNILLDCLSVKELLVAAAKAVDVSFRRFQKDPSLPVLLQFSLPRVLALRAIWASTSSSSDIKWDEDAQEICYSLTTLFSYIAESTLDLMLTPNVPNFGQFQLIEQLLECCRFKFDTEEHLTSRFALQFFYLLKQSLLEGMDSEDVNQHAFFDQAREQFQPYFGTLLEISVEQCRLDEHLFVLANTEASHDLSISDDELERREVWQETVIDCRDVLGITPSFRYIGSSLQTKLSETAQMNESKQMWSYVESLIFAAKFIVIRIAATENTIMPWVVDALIRLPKLCGLKTTIIEFIGNCAHWFAENPTLLLHYLAELGATLQDKDFTLKSSISISSILTKCRRLPNLPVVELNALVVQMRRSQTIPAVADNAILEGFCSIISSLPAEKVAECLQVVAGSLIEELSSSVELASRDHSQTKFDSSVFGSITDRITTFMRYLRIDNVNYSNLFGQIFPLLQQAVSFSRDNDYVCEKICRLYKYTMRSMGQNFQPYLSAMTRHLAEEYSRSPLAAYLYGSSICVGEFAEDRESPNNDLLIAMLQSVTSSFFGTFRDLEMFQRKPDIVEEYFFLMAKVVGTSPLVFLRVLQGQTTVYTAAVVGLQITHRDAFRGIITFFGNTLKVVSPKQKKDLSSEIVQMFMESISRFGAELVAALLLSLSGTLTIHTLGSTRNVSRVFLDLRDVFGQSGGPFFKDWLENAIGSLSEASRKVAIDSNLAGLTTASDDECYRQLDRFFQRNK